MRFLCLHLGRSELYIAPRYADVARGAMLDAPDRDAVLSIISRGTVEQDTLRWALHQIGTPDVSRLSHHHLLAAVADAIVTGKLGLFTRDAPQETAPSSDGLYTGPARLARGNLGERLAADALARDRHAILSYKPAIAGTNQGGIDIITLRDGVVHFIDNKALTRSGNVASVSALTTNLAQNRRAALAELGQAASRAGISQAERDVLNEAVSAIQAGRIVLAVTNANVAPDARLLSGLTQRLRNQGITFIDVMR